MFTQEKPNENILKRVAEEIIGEDAVTQQITYLKQTKKPTWLSSKEWIRKLNDIEKNTYWYSDQNKKIDRTTMTQDMILENIPLEWTLDFHKTRIYQEITRNDTDNQPLNKEILAKLKLIDFRQNASFNYCDKLHETHANAMLYLNGF